MNAHGITHTTLAKVGGSHLSDASNEPRQRVVYDLGTARVIDTGISPFDGDDLVVQQRDATTGEWVQMRTFNSLSDDYAYTNARNSMQAIAARMGAPK